MKTFFFPHILLSKGWSENQLMGINDQGLITSIREGRIEESDESFHGPVIPGMPNLHSHAFQRAMAGLTETRSGDEDSFWSWRKRMYQFLEVLTPQDVEAIASQLYLEMLKAGYTSVGEFHYLHHDVDGQNYDNPAEMSEKILSASENAGIGLTHLPVLYRYGGFGANEPSSQQSRFLHDSEDYLLLIERLLPFFADHPGRRLGMAPHSLRAVTPKLLDDVFPVFEQFCPEGPIHIHISEQTAEVEDCLEWSGKRPVQWLFENHLPNARWCLIHATHLDQKECLLLGESDAVTGLCPTTEANLGDGIFPMQDFINQGGVFGIGSDSHISISVSEELRWLEYQQRLIQKQRNLLGGPSGMSTGRFLFEKALAGGAQALGLGTGGLKLDSRADFLVLDHEHPLLEGRYGDTWLDGWIFSGNAPLVRDVFVGGKQVVHEGRHVEEDAIVQNFRKTLKRILS